MRDRACGIDPAEFAREKDYGAARARREKRLLFSGAVSPHKGPHLVLEALRLIAREHPEVRLDFVGTLRSYPLEETFDLADRENIRAVAPFYRKRPLAQIGIRLGLRKKDPDLCQAYLQGAARPEAAA